MTMSISPGVYQNLLDLGIQPNVQSPSVAGIVGGARRGPLGTKYVTDRTQRASIYGVNDPTWGYMLDSADAFLYEGQQLYIKRVVEADAKYALGLIANNKQATLPAGTAFTSIPSGSLVPHSQLDRDVWDIEFSIDFVAATSFTGSINSVTLGTTTYATSHIATMTAIVQAIQTVLDGLGTGGYATLINVNNTNRIIRIVSPQSIDLIIVASTTGGGAPVCTSYATDWLSFVVTENPGAWGNGIAAGISAVDVGTPQRIMVTMSAALITANVITLVVNGHTSTATFATSSNNTLALLKTAFESANPGAQLIPQAIVGGGVNSTRQFLIVAPNALANFTVTSMSVTLGVSQATLTYAESLKRIAPTGQFNFVVYENTNFRTPDEFFKATYVKQVDGLGNQLELDYSVNTGTHKSPRVRVYVNPFFSGTVNGTTSPTNSNFPRYLTGGNDGSLPTNASIVTGWDAFAKKELIPVRILINGGYSTPEVQQKMISLCETRMDCFAVMDTPSDQQTTQAAVDYRRFQTNIDSKYGAIYSPDVLIFDSATNMRRYIPPSGLVAAQYAYTDRVAAEWFAAAGLTRGLIQNALGLRVNYDEGDRDLLSPYQVNAIRVYGERFPIWGEYTMQVANSPLSSAPVVRLVITIMVRAADAVAYSLFEPNDPMTWHRVTAVLTDLLQPIENARGLAKINGLPGFKVYCNETNNGPTTRDARQLNASMWLRPTLSTLYIKLTSVITRQGADFDIEFSMFAGTI